MRSTRPNHGQAPEGALLLHIHVSCLAPHAPHASYRLDRTDRPYRTDRPTILIGPTGPNARITRTRDKAGAVEATAFTFSCSRRDVHVNCRMHYCRIHYLVCEHLGWRQRDTTVCMHVCLHLRPWLMLTNSRPRTAYIIQICYYTYYIYYYYYYSDTGLCYLCSTAVLATVGLVDRHPGLKHLADNLEKTSL